MRGGQHVAQSLENKQRGASAQKRSCVHPVSLLPVLSKVLESVVVSKITNHLDRHHFLSTRKFGFRQGRSAADLHLLLASILSAALDQERDTVVVALDIEGAFDHVWKEALITKLQAASRAGSLLPLLSDYLSNRHLRVTVGGREFEVQPITAGVPQGSCPGPLVWNVYINDLLHLIPNARAYADDVTLTQSYRKQEENATQSQLSDTLSRIIAWGNMWQVKFAPHKTQLLHLSRTRGALRLNFNGAALTSQDEVQDRATRLIRSGDTGPEPHLHTLQHRRDIAGLIVLFKVQEDRVSHLQPFKQPRRLSPVATRAVVQTPGELIQRRYRTCLEQRQFTNTYVKMWNAVIASGINLENTNVVWFKKTVNAWLMSKG
ncbi:putative RNA-directed DNA polymerase from transposon BS [Portunus trituberculatus]|uniref:Putative RNA-directed DNA polymerase from transposon BS n=1 Tax=Portunus trituberculatus TaxID=210409 RepID=A0A5B7E6K3_PORTR|nr:putative RNA-directed DNA polymerase from transposon BS [Portunus trituberculatus]